MAILRDCPRCYGDNKRGTMNLVGKEKWICADCGYYFTQTELKSGMIFWWCDSCGVYMNTQKGFNRDNPIWICETCGFENDVTDANVQKSKVEKLVEKLKDSTKIDTFLLNAEKRLKDLYPESQYHLIPVVLQMINGYLFKKYKMIPWRTFIVVGIYALESKMKNEFTMLIKDVATKLQWITADLHIYMKWRDSNSDGAKKQIGVL
jgi:transposase-like protein